MAAQGGFLGMNQEAKGVHKCSRWWAAAALWDSFEKIAHVPKTPNGLGYF